MHDKNPGTNDACQATDSCADRINAPQAAQGKVLRPLTSEEMNRIEKDATSELYRAVGEFTVQPTDFNQRMLGFKLEQFRDAWMAGRRRVMD